MRRGHVSINGKWYMLWRDEDGRVSQGNTARITGPWAAQMSQGPREYHDLTEESVHVWAELFAGLGYFRSVEGNTLRRAWADTRSGDVVLAPRAHGSVGYLSSYLPVPGRNLAAVKVAQTGATVEYAVGLEMGATVEMEAVQLLMRRVPTADYGTALPLSVTLVPASVGTEWGATLSVLEAMERAGEWQWVTARAGTSTVLASDNYELTVTNASGPVVEWAAHFEGTYSPYYRMREWDEVDGTPAGFISFRGKDRQRRLLAAVNNKVMYWNRVTMTWAPMSRFTQDVRQMAVFGATGGGNALLFVALAASVGIWTYTGGSLGGAWAQQPSQGQALAVHDGMLWRAQGGEVCGSRTGLASSYGNKVQVGHGGAPVIDMVSQEGQLFARTEEGIYAVTYPDTYPETGTPLATRVVNLELDRAPHNQPMMVPYGAGLLFPTVYDVQRYEGGLVTNISAGRGQALTEEDALQYWALSPTSRGVYAAVQGPGHGYSGLLVYQEPAEGAAGWHYLYRNPMPREETRAIYLTVDDYDEAVARLWFGAGAGIQYLRVPQWTRRRWVWSGADYERSGVVEYPPFDGGKAALVKDWRRVKVRARDMPKSGNITVFYQSGDESIGYFRPGPGFPMATVGAWATLGQATADGVTELAFPSSTYGYNLMLRAELETGDVLATPRLEALELWYQDVMPPLRAFRVVLVLKREMEMLDGGRMDRTVEEQWDDLLALADGSEGFTFVDELGASYTVRLTQLTRTTYRMGQRTDDLLEPEYLAYVEMLRID